ncbi:MAG: hypothetical protein COA43_08905 [Robiginitomaculum sp.]|nr:MAG: hypothetical protein COA43_08905 [Robiginitomaculum sp.]
MQNEDLNIENIMNLVISSGCLGNSSRQRQLLSYLLTENKEGRGKNIKTQSIAVYVLGRAEDFDNNTDSIVRVEMHRLRKHLALFNSTSQELKITIPKASYCIEFTQIKPLTKLGLNLQKYRLILAGIIGVSTIGLSTYFILSQIGASRTYVDLPQSCSSTKPNLLLQKSAIIGTNETMNNNTSLLVDNFLQRGLNQFSMINIVNGNVDCKNSGTPYFYLQAEIFPNGTTPFISLTVNNAFTEKLVYSHKIDMVENSVGVDPKTSIDIYKFASKLANLNGILPRTALTGQWSQAKPRQSYNCQIMVASHFSGFDLPTAYEEAIQCMEDDLKTGNRDPNTIGMLATLYIIQYQSHIPKITENPKVAAEKLLNIENIQFSSNPWVLGARLRMATGRRPINKPEIKLIMESLATQQPYYPENLILVSQIAGYVIGDWQYAKELSDQVTRLDPQSGKLAYYTQLGYELLYGTAEKSHNICHKLYAPERDLSIILCLATSNKTDNQVEAKQYRNELKAHNIISKADIESYLDALNLSPKITTEIMKWTDMQDHENIK